MGAPLCRLAAAALVLIAVGVPRPLRAGFDADVGRVVLDDDALALGLDDPSGLAHLGPSLALDGRFRPKAITEADFELDPASVIEGSGTLRLNAQLGGLLVSLDAVAEALRGRRVEITSWYRPLGTYPVVELLYLERGGAAVLGGRTPTLAPPVSSGSSPVLFVQARPPRSRLRSGSGPRPRRAILRWRFGEIEVRSERLGQRRWGRTCPDEPPARPRPRSPAS